MKTKKILQIGIPTAILLIGGGIGLYVWNKNKEKSADAGSDDTGSEAGTIKFNIVKGKTLKSVVININDESVKQGVIYNYSKDGGTIYQPSNTFSGLTANKEYSFMVKGSDGSISKIQKYKLSATGAIVATESREGNGTGLGSGSGTPTPTGETRSMSQGAADELANIITSNYASENSSLVEINANKLKLTANKNEITLLINEMLTKGWIYQTATRNATKTVSSGGAFGSASNYPTSAVNRVNFLIDANKELENRNTFLNAKIIEYKNIVQTNMNLLKTNKYEYHAPSKKAVYIGETSQFCK